MLIKKIFCKNIIIVMLLTLGITGFAGGSIASASEVDSYITNEETQQKLDGLYEYISKMKSDVELMNDLDAKEYISSYLENGKGNISLSDVLSAVVSLLFKEVRTVLLLAASIIVIGIICSLLKNLQSAFSSESVSQVAFYACYALMVVVLSRSFLIGLNMAKDVIVQITDFISKILPILVIMLGAAGGLTQAATMDPIVLALTVIIPKIYLNIIIPLILMCFVLQFANNITSEPKISNLCGLVKKSVVWLQGIIITVYIGILAVRGITSSTIDAVTMKTAKFTIDNFIPIVGKSFSDAISSVAGYSLIIKNAIGAIGLIIIILLIIYPIIKIALTALIFKLSSALLEPIADKRITKSIFAAGDSLVLINSCVLCVSLMFFVLIAIMCAAGKFVIGG